MLATKRVQAFFIGGVIFELNDDIKFYPTFFTRSLIDKLLTTDLAFNFTFYDHLMLGVAYRWNDSISMLIGYKITTGLTIGYGFNHTNVNPQNVTSGNHEIMIKYELISKYRNMISPRYF